MSNKNGSHELKKNGRRRFMNVYHYLYLGILIFLILAALAAWAGIVVRQ